MVAESREVQDYEVLLVVVGRYSDRSIHRQVRFGVILGAKSGPFLISVEGALVGFWP